jgi:hypothetical protein
LADLSIFWDFINRAPIASRLEIAAHAKRATPSAGPSGPVANSVSDKPDFSAVFENRSVDTCGICGIIEAKLTEQDQLCRSPIHAKDYRRRR